ncbi:hypothetical protein HYH03_000494 [Edaphochlamys debaryana]|uniref:Uncharacterized protein n=1 Tax=Edaphochlamys debaryana TaxID=47281 RepID=A0A835YIT1_9CHLO|nr:hypothetical protein HYH03_000494 [Edaphochlamys debaryana]|eukprot:KAG2501998.1 hypothetical protein HYH03_000494 [Edaphochlamys debaryana]
MQQPAGTWVFVPQPPAQPLEVPAAAHDATSPAKKGSKKSSKSKLRPVQVQLLEVQGRLESLLRDASEVETENRRLKNRLGVLEALAPVRETQLNMTRQIMRESPPDPDDAPPTVKAPSMLHDLLRKATGEDVPCSSGTTASSQRADDAPSPSPSYSGPSLYGYGATPPSMLGDFFTADSAQVKGARSSGHGISPSPEMSSGTERGQSRGGAEAGPSRPDRNRERDQAKEAEPLLAGAPRMPWARSKQEARLLRTFGAWVREAALLVIAHETRPSERYLKRLESAFDSLTAEVVRLGLHNPALLTNMRYMNLETGEEETPPADFWPAVAAGMRPNIQQVAACRTALSLYQERMAAVMAERQALSAKLQACLEPLQRGVVAAGGFAWQKASVEMEELTTALDATLTAEAQIVRLVRDVMSSSVFTQLQKARGSVMSYPYFADYFAIVEAVAHTTPVDAFAPHAAAAAAAVAAPLAAPSNSAGSAGQGPVVAAAAAAAAQSADLTARFLARR